MGRTKTFFVPFFYGLLFWFKLLTIHLTANMFLLGGDGKKLCIVNGSFLQWKGGLEIYMFLSLVNKKLQLF